VLKNTVMPAVLVENAFISNQSEEALLKDDNKREQFAEAIAKGICNHLGIKYEFNSNNHWAQKYYDYLISKGISIHETRFDDPITRGEVFVLLAKVMGYKG